MAPQPTKSTGHKLGATLALASTAVLLFLFYVLYEFTKADLRSDLELRQSAILEQANATIENYLSVAERDMRYLTRSTRLRQNITSGTTGPWTSVESDWVALMQSRSDIYDQVRFIDLEGRERARVNNNLPDTSVVPQSGLQSKVNRYYVSETLNLSVGSLYFSAFDLNVERGAIELPLKPTLRIATPIEDLNGLKTGVVVLNYKGADMLSAVSKIGEATGQQLWMANNDGHWLIGPSPAVEWSFMYPSRPAALVSDRFPRLWSEATQQSSFVEGGYQLSTKQVNPELGFALFENVVLHREGGWRLIVAYDESLLQAQTWQIMRGFAPAFVLMELFLVGLSLWGGRQIRLRAEAIHETAIRERQLTVIFESAPDATLISDKDGIITRANSAVEKLLGYRPDELVGQSIDLLVPDRIHNTHSSLRSHYYNSPVPRSVASRTRLTARRHDGTEIPVSIALNSLMIDGEMQVLSALRDMTADHQASSEILNLNQRLEIAANAAKIGIWELDTRSGSLVWDRQMYKHYGLDAEFELNLSNWMALIDEEDRELVNRHMRETILDGSEFDLVVQAQNVRGDEIWVRLIATTKLDTDGFTQTLIGTELDVTEEVRVERELRVAYEKSSEANVELEALNQELEESREAAEQGAQVKSDFLANMSHEIRTPLNAVLGINHLLERQVHDNATRDLIAKQDRAAQSLLGIINDILDYSKIESGKLELEQSPFSLYELLDNLTTLVGEQASKKGLHLAVMPPPVEFSGVIGDYLRLEQVLVNLCSNAIKFTEQGEVRVIFKHLSTNASKLNLKFSVRDTGVGIPQPAQRQLFTPFTQADASVSREYGGTGLGLSIAANLVRLMGGEISIDSQVGRGSEFSFVLSLSRQSINRMPLVGLTGRPVLLNSYNEAISSGIEGMLAAFGAKVARSTDLEEAIREVLSNEQLQTSEAIVVVDADAYLPPDLQSILLPLAGLPEQRRPLVAMAMSTDEALEHDYSDVFSGAVQLRYPLGPLALYNSFVARDEPDSQSQQTAEQRLGGSRILVVDDNTINLDVAKMMLEEEGARVWLAQNGIEALEMLRKPQFKVDVVLMDVQMPGMDGLEATRQIRADNALVQTPVLALTAGVTPVQRSAAMEAGMNGFITKPIDMDRAVALLRSVIARGVAQVPEHEQVEVEEASQPKPDAPVVLNQDYGLRVFKTREKYQRYLHLFVQMYERSIDELEALTEQPELLRALVHKMRGGAGHLGIDQVRDLCAQLESEIDEHQAYANTLEKLGNALRNCFEQIEKHFPLDKPVVSVMEAILDPAQLIEPLKALHTQLQNYDLDSANSIFQGVSSKLKATDRMALQNCIDLFDAKGALAEVERIAADLKIALK